MRANRKFVAAVAAMAALFSASIGSVPSSQAALSQQQKDQLTARRAQLVAQLQTLLATQHGAAADLGTAEAQYMAAQGNVTAVSTQLTATNKRLSDLQAAITAEQAHDAAAQRELALVTRASYESAGDRSLIANLLSSSDFGQAMQRVKAADSVTTDVNQLQADLQADEARMAKQRADLQTQFAAATTLERQYSDVSSRFLVAVADRNSTLAGASTPVKQLEAQIADIDNELAADQLPATAPPVSGGATCGDRFAFGQCTWYVATRRCIPWSGNANQWYRAAAAMGYLEGHVPAVGAVVVFWPGGDGAGGVGHVAYVEAVGPASGIPAGYFKLSEMNFGGWDRVNYRVLPGNSSGIQGFIYGHG